MRFCIKILTRSASIALQKCKQKQLWYDKHIKAGTHSRRGNNEAIRPLGTDYREENVMNLKNVQRWQLMFRKERTNINNVKYEGQPSTMLNNTA